MLVGLAGIVIVLLIASEILAIAPAHQAQRVRRIAVWCTIPVLVIFAAAWLLHVRSALVTAP